MRYAVRWSVWTFVFQLGTASFASTRLPRSLINYYCLQLMAAPSLGCVIYSPTENKETRHRGRRWVINLKWFKIFLSSVIIIIVLVTIIKSFYSVMKPNIFLHHKLFQKKQSVVQKFSCFYCDFCYIGKTKRSLKARIE